VSCAICVASRRSVVDGIVAGYVLGYKDAIKSDLKAGSLGYEDFCLAHETMICEAIQRELKKNAIAAEKAHHGG
jgi:hypothetical protein